MITRHNYEEFFLMYVDDELTAEERVAVNLFVQQNPDLAEELEMLQQTKLIADDSLQFEDKKMLLQNVDEIGIDNYEEQFLLYIDKELDDKKRDDVEKFVLQHPQFQDEFTLLKQTVLEPEKVIFEDKASLLRKEERRIVPMFIRLAVAAAVIGIAVMMWFSWNNNSSSTQLNVAANDNSNTTKDNVTDVPKTNPLTPDNKDDQIVLPDIAVAPKENEQQKKEEVASVKQKTEKKEQQKVLLEKVEQDVIQKEQVAVNNTSKNTGNTKATADVQSTHDDVAAKNVDVQDNGNTTTDYAKNDNNTQHDNFRGYPVATTNNENPIVTNAVYKELNTDEEDNKSALYLGSLQLNKNKVRGLVKKVGGLFAGRSKDAAKEDGKLQIANLEINTN